MRENANPVNVLDTKWKRLVDPYKEEALVSLRELLRINSVLDETTKSKTMPFGKGVDDALKYVASLGERLGFKVDRCDNYVTELTYGDGDKIFDIYAHCDVVPVKKEKWHYNPFDLTLVDDNIMYGRGTSDDKGPGLACLYAVKALMDNNMLGGYKLRFLFGGNEENDSLCLKHYFEDMKKEYPTLGISPDADYPLIYAEKSIYAYKASYEVNLPNIKSFSLGDALNIVLGEAECELIDEDNNLLSAFDAFLKQNQLTGETQGKKIKIIGKPCHGSTPWLGVNAGLYLLKFLGEYYHENNCSLIYDLYKDGKGDSFCGNFKDVYFTETSYNVGKIEFDSKKVTIYVNFRFPSTMKLADVIKTVENNTKAKLEVLGGSDGFVSDPKSDFVQMLLKSYQEETNDYESKPLAIGGGTYARESKNSVAFGAQFPNRDYRMHGNDEFFPKSDFLDNMQIYAHAIYLISNYLREGK